MQSIYGPPPGARQPRRGSKPRPTPRWKQALQGLALVIVGLAAFALLVWLEVSSGGGDDDDDPLHRLERLQFNLPRYDPIVFDMPIFKPMQAATIIPSSAIHPAEPAAASKPARRLQTAGIISR